MVLSHFTDNRLKRYFVYYYISLSSHFILRFFIEMDTILAMEFDKPASTCEMELRQGYVIGNDGFDFKSAFHLLLSMLFSAF